MPPPKGLDVTLVREVSWSNVRDKLNIGLFDAAHLLAPVAIASSLGLGHVKVPIVAPFNLGINGNAITVSPALHAAIMEEIDGDRFDPMATALALSRVVAKRRKSGAEPLTFGMTFPFSTHNYQLRFWMAAGGVDPDEDVRLVVLPPPYMVDSLANGHVDAFCVGAPWNSVAVDLGIGHILHFVADILVSAVEKVLARPAELVGEESGYCRGAGPRRISAPPNSSSSRRTVPEAARILARPERIGVDAEVIQRTLDGRLKISPDGTMRESEPLSAGGAGGCGAARSDAGRLALCADGAVGADGAEAGGAQDGHGGVQAGSLRRRSQGSRESLPALPSRSAPSPAPHSIRTTSPAIWRHSRSATGRPESEPVQRCWAVAAARLIFRRGARNVRSGACVRFPAPSINQLKYTYFLTTRCWHAT